MRTTTALLVALLVAAPALGETKFYDGNKLKPGLDDFRRALATGVPISERTLQDGMAVGYVVGVADAYAEILVCPPPNVVTGQLVDIVTKYLDEHPEERHKKASLLVVTALAQAFPCPKK